MVQGGWSRRIAVACARPFVAVESPETYAALRIGLGALVIANVSTLWPHLDYLYGDLGLAPAASACGQGMARLSILCHLPAWGPAALLVALTATALAFTLGLATRVSGWLTVALYASLWWRSGVSWAGEHVFADFLFLLCLARCGEAYSIDRWLRRRRGDAVPWTAVPSWPRYLMIVQLGLCLGVNGWAKSGAAWRDGEAIYYVLANDRFHRFPPWALFDALGPELVRGLTWIAWLTERGFVAVLLGLLLRPRLIGAGVPGWIRHLADWTVGRRVWATLAAALMLGITALMNVGWFPAATAVAVLCLFRGDELGRLMVRGRRQDVSLAPSRPPRRRAIAAIGVFAGWHAWVMTTRALVPVVGETVTRPIAEAMLEYQRLTNTTQMWRMFSPGVPKVGHSLRVVARTADGGEHEAPSDLELLDHGRGFTIGYDRRYKIFAVLTEEKREPLRRAHGRWVCARWRGPAGERPIEVVLSRIEEPLPPPAWFFSRGAANPEDYAAAGRREVELTRVTCEAQLAEVSNEVQ